MEAETCACKETMSLQYFSSHSSLLIYTKEKLTRNTDMECVDLSENTKKIEKFDCQRANDEQPLTAARDRGTLFIKIAPLNATAKSVSSVSFSS